MKKSSFAEAFYKNAGYFVVALISLVYVASSLISISRTGKSIYEIVGTGVISLIVGALINGVFRSMGIRRGDEDERMVATTALHCRAVDEIVPYIDRLDDFCQEENKRALKEIRTRILAREGLKYQDFFDGEGALIKDLSSLNDKGKRGRLPIDTKRIALKRALRVKIKPLSSSGLTSDCINPSDPFDFGKSKREYTSKRSTGDILLKLLMAVVFGYFGVGLTGEINTATLIWNALQISLYVTGGIIQMYSSYMWVIEDYRSSIIRKIDYLQKFHSHAVKITQNNN